MTRKLGSPNDVIAVLEQAKIVLGRGGKNWIKGSFFGRRAKFHNLASGSYEHVRGVDADCYCLMGAIERAAYDLGYTVSPVPSPSLSGVCSIEGLIKNKYGVWIASFNDDPNTTWKDILGVLNLRIKQLKKENCDRGAASTKK